MIEFNEKYNTQEFSNFLYDFLPDDYNEDEKDITELTGCQCIKNVRELGHCESLDVTVLEMSHSEKDPRISIATDAFKIMRNYDMQKALVIFNNDENDNYRFSYLTIKLDIDENNKIKKTYSNARRYSFFLGIDAKVQTPKQQLINKGKIKDVEDLFSRFSIEVVNKEFYAEVAMHFNALVSNEKENLVLPSMQMENMRKNFATRLIGRIMFCWFLKQKKSEKGQLIPDELLSSQAVKANYYHEVLERLFFEILNTEIDEREIRSDLYDVVPYLNGGLFNPHEDDFYEFDKEVFVSKYLNVLKVKDEWLKSFFELLETYNFTIDENTIFDQELSVDPEMLGRIFENLLAEQDEVTGESARKADGSFYTPRQIVEYMVDESLGKYFTSKTGIRESKIKAMISYDEKDDLRYPLLKEDKQKIIDAITEVKILDPACGSGAFPIGILQKIIYILQVIDKDGKLWRNKQLCNIPELYKQKMENEFDAHSLNYICKLEVIKNSIFGVDIQPVAVEIARLRCFLTLVVDDEIDDAKKNRGIDPLPNLDFKFACANTLISLPKVRQQGMFEDYAGIDELEGLMSQYFSSKKKTEIQVKFAEAQKNILSNMIDAFGKTSGDLTIKLTQWNPFSDSKNEWFDSEWMFGIKDEFDIVIGNPPYVQLQKNSGQLADIYKSCGYEVFQRTGDIYTLFYEKGLELTKKNTGLLCYITSNKWMRAGYGKSLRGYFANKNPLLLLDFGGFKVFESATVDTNILLIQNKENENYTRAVHFTNNYKKGDDMTEYVEENCIEMKNISEDTWAILSPIEQQIKEKIERVGTPLKDWNIKINRGILTGYNKAFIIDGKKKDELIAKDSKSAEIIKPILRGRDIKRYSAKFADKWLIATHNGYKEESGEKIEAVKIENYPVVKEWLDLHWNKIKKRQDKGKTPYNLRNCAYQEEFEKEKIIYPETTQKAHFFFNKGGQLFCDKTNFILTGDNLKYITSVLSSTLITYFYKKHCGGTVLGVKGYQYNKHSIEKIPLFKISKNKQEIFEQKVDKILEIKKQNLDADTSELEKQIDKMVYELYDLTEEEIKVIEKNL